MNSPFSVDVTPNSEGLISCIRREGTPDRVYFIELFLDGEVQTVIADRYGVWEGIDPEDPHCGLKRQLALQRFLGYDFVRAGVDGVAMPLKRSTTEDTAELKRESGRSYMELHKGPITNWEEFEAYPWPNPEAATTQTLEWCEQNLPDDMCIISLGVSHFAEHLCWLMGYETLCLALYDQRDLVEAISKRLMEINRVVAERLVKFDRVKAVWGSDDMGFRSQTLISPDDMREFVLPGHKMVAAITHEAGMPYLLHSCGNLEEILPDLIDDVQIDAKHSFEDTFETVTKAKDRYGDRIALLGGIDVDFLCRASEAEIRQRVRETLEKCMPGGGYCLGSGNSVANYIPVDNYLAMVDEGRRFGG